MASEAQISQDLALHATQDMEQVLNRHMKIAMGVLPPAEVGVILLQIANGVALGAALYSLQMSKDDMAAADVWDMVRSCLNRLLEAGRPNVMARFEQVGRAVV